MSDAPFYWESEVWQKLHGMPDWPDVFHVGINVQPTLIASLQQLREAGWERGYTITVTPEPWNRRTLATFRKAKQ